MEVYFDNNFSKF